jgi:uncharacterized membrane protein
METNLHRRCRIVLIASVLAGCVGTYVGIRLTGTDAMSIKDAMELMGHSLTDQQRKLVAAALRRQGLIAVRELMVMAREQDSAGIEATEALRQIREVIR